MNDPAWITVEQVTEFEGISRMEVYRRMQPGDSHAFWFLKSVRKASRAG